MNTYWGAISTTGVAENGTDARGEPETRAAPFVITILIAGLGKAKKKKKKVNLSWRLSLTVTQRFDLKPSDGLAYATAECQKAFPRAAELNFASFSAT